MTDTTPEFAVLVLERVVDDKTEEHHKECMTFVDALVAAQEAAHAFGRDWVAITIVHAADYPKFIENAEHGGQA